MSTATTHAQPRLSTRQRYERDLVMLADAARLAQMWEHALRASFELGRATGYQAGWLTGRDEEATAWQAIVTGYSAVLSEPDRAELARLRAPSNEPCARRCAACSQCARAAGVVWNLAHYGRADFPGTAVRPLPRQGSS